MLPLNLLNKKGFISVATSSLDGVPNAAPKLICSADDNFIYLADYLEARTWNNLKVNPRVSISFSDQEGLLGYQINGPVEILTDHAIPDEIRRKLENKTLSLSVDRVVRGVRENKRHEVFEIDMPAQYVVYKVKVEEVIEIGPKGELQWTVVGPYGKKV